MHQSIARLIPILGDRLFETVDRESGPITVDRVKAFVLMKRGGQPGEVAAAVLWLLSDEASDATGTFLDPADGR